ncbi:hypothetical protein [Acinetobacter sp.]|uniref:hypothetical protein n=1 Tax=Acinetobacter sp. TaxID=472 RepID=UPI002FC7B457
MNSSEALRAISCGAQVLSGSGRRCRASNVPYLVIKIFLRAYLTSSKELRITLEKD